ncbi:MAG: membrane dipeptidase, partial [Veillonella parvula]|nr:membrane dipeptidase [Veillonella parvula]
YEEMRNLCVSQIHHYGEHIQHVLSYQDVESVYKSGKIGAIMSIEEGGVLGGDLNKLKQAYQDGVRLITLTWNYPNGLGEPHCGEQHKKLTSKGVEFVEAMQDLGIIVDCSHLNDAGTEQLGDILDVPFIASHSNAANKGGIIGLNFAQNFLGTSPISRIEDIVKHGLYLIDKGGEDVVALGTDFDGIPPNTEIADMSQMSRLYDAFKEAGLSVEQCEKLFWKNADRLLKEIL